MTSHSSRSQTDTPIHRLEPITDGAPWYAVTEVRPGLRRIIEPEVDEFLQASMWLVEGSKGHVLIDCGLGVVPIMPRVLDLVGGDCPVILTHGHLDHAGAAHEFTERWGHPADEVTQDRRVSLITAEHTIDMGLPHAEATDRDAVHHAPTMLRRAPVAGYDAGAYVQRAAPLTRELHDGNIIDLGSTKLEVVHLPGHTPGSIALYDKAKKELFSGDIVYDDVLLDSLPESDPDRYAQSLRRLLDLDVRTVFPGHGTPFDAVVLLRAIHAYLAT